MLMETGSRDRREVGAEDGLRQDRACLIPDVVRFLGPRNETVPDGVQIEIAGCGLFGDADRHLCVVGPLAGVPAERSATVHLDRTVEGWSELVSGAEGVSGGEADEYSCDPIIPCVHCALSRCRQDS